MSRSTSPTLLTLFGLCSLALLSPGPADAAATDEFVELTGNVDPNIIFVLDMSASMAEPCALEGDDTSEPETGGGGPSAPDSGGAPADVSYATPCYVLAMDAINQISMHYDGVRIGVVGTAEDRDDDSFTPIAPLGSSPAEIAEAMFLLEPYISSPTRNLAETLSSLASDYLTNTDPDNGEDDDGDGIRADWSEAGIEYSCQDTHVIVFTRNRPGDDRTPGATYLDPISGDVVCDGMGYAAVDEECKYDNIVAGLYNADLRSDLSDDQNVVVHTISLGVDEGSIADTLFTSASEATDGEGIYENVDSADTILSTVMTVMRDIRSGIYSRSPPVISADGSYLLYAFYEIDGDNPLAEGHVRAYEIDDDPTSDTYGQVVYDGPSEYGGAVWDAGDLLVSRPVYASESQLDDRNGFGQRDIYTFFEPATVAMSGEALSDKRMGLDADFVSALEADPGVMGLIMNMDVGRAPPCADDQAYDLTGDCLVDADDLQTMIDFARGLPEATFRYLDTERGRWKLGDSPHSVPLVVSKRNNSYTVDPTYKTFLYELEHSDYPDIVLIAANDGMLHAFQLEDDKTTLDTEEGEELWAWIPGQLLYRSQDAEWAGRLLDLMLYGRTFLFDGTPVVEDVWIDADDDNEKDCTDLSDCEWRRVVVVQQGMGGVVTLALDITDPTAPEYLWEQTDTVDNRAMGYTISTPVIANIYDKTGDDPSEYHDRWVAMWGSGRAVPWASGRSNYEVAEANIYMWHIGDDVWGTADVGYATEGDNGHPEKSLYGSSLDSDSDDHYEYGYISGALAVVDVDSDGDADTVYFPVTTSYSPVDEGGDGPGDVQDPGATWMYKACIPGKNPDNLRWVEFYDPVDDSSGAIEKRPEIYYAATTSWHSNGSLGVYWGSGSPYTRDFTAPGYFFAMTDTDPGSCAADTMLPISDCGADGVVELDPGESMTGSATVYQGVVYFTTWAPGEDVCSGGEGRLYAISYEDCGAAIDLNGDGEVNADDLYREVDGYPSQVTVTDMGTVMVATATPDPDATNNISVVDNSGSLLYASQTLAWMEVL